MRNTMWTKEQVNEAIYTVLTTQFKKQAPEAFNIVKAAGYEYEKNNGQFAVKNKETDRYIYLSDGGYYNHYYTEVHYGWYRQHVTKFEGPDRDLNVKEKFDFVGCLDKPMNRIWFEMHQQVDFSEAVSKFHNLQQKKCYVQYREDDIKRIQNQMEKLQKELMSAMKYKVQYEQDVINYKKELGLA